MIITFSKAMIGEGHGNLRLVFGFLLDTQRMSLLSEEFLRLLEHIPIFLSRLMTTMFVDSLQCWHGYGYTGWHGLGKYKK